ncbi:hypothetical protein Chor_005569 [Crotalus horridus]
MRCNQSCGLLTVAAIGALLAVFGGILIPVGNHFIEKTIKKEAVIENGTIAYENWIVPGCPIYRQFWVFDVQNPEEVMEKGSAPILEQKGPYTYRMRYMPKENITEDEDGTLSYLQPNIMLFQPNMSVGPESDTVTTVNFAVVMRPRSTLLSARVNSCTSFPRMLAGKPVYLSMPHFLYGSKILFQFVKGMKPSVEEHTTFLDVEPVTGFTLGFSKRLQINLLVRPNSKIAALKNIKHFFYFPILWLNETATIDDEKADFFRSKVTNKIKLLYFLQWALIIIGSLMFLGILIVFFMCKDKRPK